MGGGIFTYIYNLTNELADTYNVYVAYSVRDQTPENFKEYFNENINLIEVQNFKREINIISDIKASFELKAITKKIDPDIIHLHSSKAGAIGRVLFNSKKTPLFYTPHGYSFLINDNWLKSKFYKLIELGLSKLSCTTISCSQGEYEQTSKMTQKSLLVNNGINISELENTVTINNLSKPKNRQRTVFTLGRITQQKNPFLFNQIAELMPNVKFLWIGDGELRHILIAKNIEIKGWLNREEALQIANQSDVFLLTSKWEGLPMALLEAMYMKKLCVVSNVSGNKDVIDNGVSGFVCNDLSAYIRALAGNNSLMAEKAHQKILDEYNTHIMAQNYNDIYAESLSKVKKI